jgi:hypothetical protein
MVTFFIVNCFQFYGDGLRNFNRFFPKIYRRFSSFFVNLSILIINLKMIFFFHSAYFHAKFIYNLRTEEISKTIGKCD